MDPVASVCTTTEARSHRLATSSRSLGNLISPLDDLGQASNGFRYERIPGGYFLSRQHSDIVFGLKLQNTPVALAELIEEVNRATPKQLFFFDSGYVQGEDNPHAVNWTDNRGCPSIIPVFLNPRRATPEVVAHEVMHSWIEFFAGLEDGRHYVDSSNLPVANVVSFVQSMILDCTVLWHLRMRGGFELDKFRKDIVAAAVENVSPFRWGLMHATPFGQLMAAQALAVPSAVPDLYELTSEDRDDLDELWRVCRRFEPTIARIAQQMKDALQNHGYQSEAGIRKAVDECLVAAFELLCVPFDPDRDIVWRTIQLALVDKMPNYMPGWPVDIKHSALRDSIRNRQHIVSSALAPGRHVVVNFAPQQLGYSPFLLPPITRPKESGKPSQIYFFVPGTSEEEMAELKPSDSELPLPAPDVYQMTYDLPRSATMLDLIPSKEQLMFYCPEIARFLSRDMIRRPGANPYTYVKNQPGSLVDVLGLQEEPVQRLWYEGQDEIDPGPVDLLREWIHGAGPAARTFNEDNWYTSVMRQHPRVGEVLGEFKQKLGKHCAECLSQGVTADPRYYSPGVGQFASDVVAFLTPEQAPGLGNSDPDLARRIIGGFKIDSRISPDCHTGSAIVSFTLTNRMTLGSATRIPGTNIRLLANPRKGNFATTTQTWRFTESFPFTPAKKANCQACAPPPPPPTPLTDPRSSPWTPGWSVAPSKPYLPPKR